MSGRKPADPARAARERLIRQERQARAEAHARAVAEGVAETVALSRARGAAIAEPPPPGRKRACAQPYRRQTGLEWLAAKGRITAEARAAGERYGLVYRRVKLDKAIPSTLDVRIRSGFVPPDLARVMAHGEGTEVARRKLAEYRRRLLRQPDLVAACDLVCGEEKTPREAAAGDRDVTRLEAVLKVALDILAEG
jgi:hypothetical protein